MSALDAIYARQSVEKADSLSIQGQIDLCRRETAEEVKIYQDKGYSGKNTNRPAFQRLMADVEKGMIQKIVVYRLDRFSRSIADFGRLWGILERHCVAFVSVNETFDTATPMGRAMLNIIMVFAQLERETTAERVRDNYYQRAKLGAWPGGPAPYGFSIGTQPSPEGRPVPSLLPNDKSSVVERIFTRYALPASTLGSVARELNADGIPGPRRAVWDSASLSRILHSPIYVQADEEIYLYYQGKGLLCGNSLDEFDGRHAGMIVGKRERGTGKHRAGKEQHFSLANHRGQIPAALWLQCQHKLERNRQVGGRGRGKHTWLSGLMKCASCGYSIKVNREGEKYYLLCSGRSNLGLCQECIQVDLRALERAVAEELDCLLRKCPQEEIAPENPETKQALTEIDRKMERLMAALTESSALTMKYINQTIQTLEERRAELLQRQAVPEPRPAVRRLAFGALAFEEKKWVAAQLIQEIRLSGDRAEVIWKV